MILKKLLSLAFLLKDAENIHLLFTEVDGKKNFNPDNAIGLLKYDLIEKICTVLNDAKPVNEIDALAGIADFFLQFRMQAKASPNLRKLVSAFPLGEDLRIILSWIIGND